MHAVGTTVVQLPGLSLTVTLIVHAVGTTVVQFSGQERHITATPEPNLNLLIFYLILSDIWSQSF